MIRTIRTNVLTPLATRIGTIATGTLLGVGAGASEADWVGTGIAGALLIGSDLLMDWLRKRAIVDRTLKQVMGTLWPEAK